jgi:hypothetical protein
MTFRANARGEWLGRRLHPAGWGHTWEEMLPRRAVSRNPTCKMSLKEASLLLGACLTTLCFVFSQSSLSAASRY